MRYLIVSDSSSNIFRIEGVNYTTVPMKIIFDEKEYIDAPELDVAGMVADLKAYKGKSGSSCPNAQEWLDAFGDADMVFGVTISRNLSGSYNAAQQAARDYMEEHPGRRVHIFDSFSAGPEMAMIAERIAVLADGGAEFDAIVEQVEGYQNCAHTLFCLESMNNLARNGRINPAVAKIAGMLGIRACGEAQNGQIIPLHKPRGAKKATATLLEMVEERGFADGNWLRISHCFGETPAQALIDAVREKFPNARITLEPTGALCSFYAETGGLIIGFEGAFNEVNNVKDI